MESRRQGRRFSGTALASGAVSLLSLLFLLGVGGVFLGQSLPAWRAVGFELVHGREWFFRSHQYGAASMVYGTGIVAVVALGVAVPVGFGAALFSAEILGARARWVVKAALELLAGIPSVVYGLLGILFLRTWVYQAFEAWDLASGDTLLTAGLLVGLMILPTLMTLADDALMGVGREQRQAARALGMTRAESVVWVVLPQAWPGLLASVLLALGRAAGEMIAVFLVVGRQDNQWPARLFTLQPLLEPGQTLASKLGSSETNIAYGDPVHWGALMTLGLLLLLLVGGATWIAFRLNRRSSDA